MKIEKYTIGMGDRFAQQGRAQLRAVMRARELGINVHPVWNKSNREHTIIHSQPDDLRAEADAAVAALGWKEACYVDADHIGLKTVDRFLQASNFFTLDVADFVGKPSAGMARFQKFIEKWGTEVRIPGMGRPLSLSPAAIEKSSAKFLQAMNEAGAIYRHILAKKDNGDFVVEVSVDETDSPQTPDELFLILAMLAMEEVPVQTIAPKFTGRFNKGVDYVGDLAQFEKEFGEDIAVLSFAVREFGLPESLKLSVHSGSDKFSLYPVINRLLKKHGCGLHVKTAGTTWLEEVIGLAESGGDGLSIARDIYKLAHGRYAELAAPYATVIDVDPSRLPAVEEVMSWGPAVFSAALRHDRNCPEYNPHFRQLIHVAFKVAAEMGPRFLAGLRDHREVICGNVTHNLLVRHIIPLFGPSV
ncbi:MAG: tagaturonate epimerase family protein [Verrucomicrobiota bacterium]